MVSGFQVSDSRFRFSDFDFRAWYLLRREFVMTSAFRNAGLTSAKRPTEHQQTDGSDPASGDAHGDSCPVRPQLNHERGSKDHQDEHPRNQSKKSDDSKP